MVTRATTIVSSDLMDAAMHALTELAGPDQLAVLAGGTLDGRLARCR